MAKELSGMLNSKGELVGNLTVERAKVEPYSGDYEVYPSTEEQVLHTANKILSKDIHIAAIPYTNVSNESGGLTAYIAKEV